MYKQFMCGASALLALSVLLSGCSKSEDETIIATPAETAAPESTAPADSTAATETPPAPAEPAESAPDTAPAADTAPADSAPSADSADGTQPATPAEEVPAPAIPAAEDTSTPATAPAAEESPVEPAPSSPETMAPPASAPAEPAPTTTPPTETAPADSPAASDASATPSADAPAANASAAVPLTEFAQDISSSAQVQTMQVNEKQIIPVTVKNTGSETWPAGSTGNPVTLGLSWVGGDGKVVERSRALLVSNVAPGDSVTLMANVKAPAQAGEYTLHMTMVQEKVAFFDEKGATPLEMRVSVTQ